MSSFFFLAEDGAESSVRTGSVVEDGAQNVVRILWKMASRRKDEDGDVCSMRCKHSCPAANAESPDAQILPARQVSPLMHRLCEVMLNGAMSSVRNENLAEDGAENFSVSC